MIRRSVTLPEGPGWLLIAQRDHALLAGELAARWSSIVRTDAAARIATDLEATFCDTVRRHDDGWVRADAAPRVDPHLGRPVDFLETPQVESLAIWRRSIRGVADIGPLAALLVAGHFCRLLSNSPSAPNYPPASAFVAEHRQLSRRWLAQWITQAPDCFSAELADELIKWLQLFDRLSLWFCMADRQDPLTTPAPDGREITWTPEDESVVVRPWPFTIDAWTLSVAGRAVPTRRYQDAEDLASEPGVAKTLRWRIAPGA